VKKDARYKFFGITIGVSDLVKTEMRQCTLLPEVIAKVVGVVLFLKYLGYLVCHSCAENNLLALIGNRFYTWKAPDSLSELHTEKQKTSTDLQILPLDEDNDNIQDNEEDTE